MSAINDPIQVKRQDRGGCTIGNSRFHLCSESIAVRVSGEQLTSFAFVDSKERSYCLGGIDGVVLADVSRNSQIEVRRELFVASDGQSSAVRFAVKNISKEGIRFDGIDPVILNNEASFSVGGAKMPQWKMLRYPFHKNDIPSYFKPTVVDKDFEDAVFSCVGAVPGQGVLYNRLNCETRTITAGPMLIIRNDEAEDATGLILCTTGIEKHFMEMFLTTTEDRQNLKEFKIACEFDGIVLNPGDEAETHWILIAPGKHESDLVGLYTETVATMYNLPAERPVPPTVYCSWYFYTFNLDENYLQEELDSIRERNIPLDVFQIDDGWMDNYGSFEPDLKKFPNGMKAAADKIKEHGMVPGIWACPFVIEVDSPILEKYPDLMQLDRDGNKIIYDTSINDCYILDPTAPGSIEYLTETLTKFKEWGYTYFKLDWLRAMYEFDTVRFRDPTVNRAMAYSMAMKAIRNIIGPDCYVCGCGGLSDPGNFGSVNAQRTCKDVRGIWHGPEAVNKSGAIVHIKQNILRNYINRFYHSDPDGSQIRIRKQRFFENERKCVGVYQSEGHYTDEEAFTIIAQQYVCGGLVMISERFPELQEGRLAMLRNIAPSCGVNPAKILDFNHPVCPTMFLNEVKPKCKSLGNWWILAVGNWEDDDSTRTVSLDHDMIPADLTSFAVFEFRTQKFLGLFDRKENVKLDIPAHGTRILRITPWGGQMPALLGTDLHITGGGYEIAEFNFANGQVTGKLDNPWRCPVAVTVGLPDEDNSIRVTQTMVPAGEDCFAIAK